MAREPRAPRPKLDLPGQRPLLQGHLRRGGQRPTDAQNQGTDAGSEKSGSAEVPTAEVPTNDEPEGTAGSSATPATEVASGPAAAARGKATRTPAELATRRHLEGSEEGPT
jgi:hypothetical protein